MAEKIQHPCFECTLPDCDDTSKRCALKVALNRYEKFKRNKVAPPEDVRRQYSIAWQELYGMARLERKALERAERAGA